MMALKRSLRFMGWMNIQPISFRGIRIKREGVIITRMGFQWCFKKERGAWQLLFLTSLNTNAAANEPLGPRRSQAWHLQPSNMVGERAACLVTASPCHLVGVMASFAEREKKKMECSLVSELGFCLA